MRKIMLFSCMLCIGIFGIIACAHSESMKAITQDGQVVILNEDGTWEFEEDQQKSKKEYLGSKPSTARNHVEDKRGDRFRVHFTDDWKPAKQTNPDAMFEFEHVDGDVYAMVISERLKVPLESVRDLFLMNAEEAGATGIRVTKEEMRTVNGVQVLCIEVQGTLYGIDFVYLAYLYSGDIGTVQIIAYTGKNLYNEYKSDMEELLNGFVVM